MRILLSALLALGICLQANFSFAQSPRPVPYSAQLRTDPSVGNVQGIQRYGRPLRTDPDQGEGFSYHVYPVADSPGVIAQVGGNLPVATSGQTATQGIAESLATEIEAARAGITKAIETNDSEAQQFYLAALNEALAKLEATGSAVNQSLQTVGPGAGPAVFTQPLPAASPYPTPFDWTQGIRNVAPGGGAGAYVPRPQGAGYTPTQSYSPSQSYSPEQALVFSRESGNASVYELFQQPLIQIKMRVVEVERTDQLAANSILEYVSTSGGPDSLTSGDPLNNGEQNLQGITNFALDGLISDVGTGAGSLINLTSQHINWVASILATRFDADVITAPEMVTTNGQNVEFVAGSKLPFQLGQNVINGSSNNIQQVFYKHVGTMVSVTPTIINWGFHGEGRGEGAISAQEIPDWNELVRWMVHNQLIGSTVTFGDTNGATYNVNEYADTRLLPFGLKSELLAALNEYGRTDLLQRGLCLIHPEGPNGCNNWKPDDCTIDLTVVVRLSDSGTVTSVALGDDPDVGSFNAEKNIRAVANVIQVKSGHGVVMAGLIGERELEEEAKVPVLGDLPLVGAAFRSRKTSRNKTEVLIFIEAKVLDRDPGIARVESSNDFLLGKGYVDGEFLENPLECGMYQVGFGSYLPPIRRSECDFWERHGRKLRNVGTHVSDVLK